jgi:phosphoglycolate phosphatase-like HAD superfamily hydrolase
MLRLCLFDLDQTLVKTDDMKALRESGKNRVDQAYTNAVVQAFGALGGRLLYSRESLDSIKSEFSGMKLGVFTRSPRSYTQAVLQSAYPGFNWDVVVAYEDVKRTKPSREGIWHAMNLCKVKYVDQVALVGDSDVDVRSAYHAGVYAVVDTRAWPKKKESDHWRALGHIPDAVIESDAELLTFLRDQNAFVPDLEWRLEEKKIGNKETLRFDKVNKFVPREIGGDNKPFPVAVCGRSFSGYESLGSRRQWHDLTESVKSNKNAKSFPAEWVGTVVAFIKKEFARELIFGGVTVAVVPHRPDREPRLESFLAQIEASLVSDRSVVTGKLSFAADLLGYKNGVRSNSKEHLSPVDRFANVRDHLQVNRPDLVKGTRAYVVIDDVTTTGATLIYATKYLKAAGAIKVVCLALAMNVSDVTKY